MKLIFFILSNHTIYGQCESSSNKTQTIDSLICAKDYDRAILTINHEISKLQTLKYLRRENLYDRLFDSYLKLENWKKAKKIFNTSLDVLQITNKTNTSEMAYTYEKLGLFYFVKAEPDRSIVNYNKNLSILKKMSNIDSSAIHNAYVNLASNYWEKKDFDLVKSFLDSSKIFTKQNKSIYGSAKGDYFDLSARLKFTNENYEEAVKDFHSAILQFKYVTCPNLNKIARIYVNLGFSYYHNWDFENAEKYINKSLDINLKEIGENTHQVSLAYSYLARIYARRGAYDKALEYNKKTIKITTKLYGENDSRTGHAYLITGMVYGFIDYFENELYYSKKALAIFIRNFGEEHRRVVTAYQNIGRTYFRMQQYDESLKYHEKAIYNGNKIFDKTSPALAHIYLNAADAYAAMEMNEKAVILLEESLKIQKAVYGEKHREIAQNYISQGKFYTKLGNYVDALSKYDTVLHMYHTEIQNSLKTEFVDEEFNVLYKIIDALESKALCLFLRYNTSNQMADLLASNLAYQSSNIISEKMRSSTINYADKIQLSASNQISPKGAVKTHFLLFEATCEPKNLEKAFSYSEKNRAAVLREFSQRNQSAVKLVKDSVLELEIKLKTDRSIFLSKIENENRKEAKDTLAIESFQAKLFQTNRKYDSILKVVKKNFPKHFLVEHSRKPISILEIQSRLDKQTTLLEYFVADSSLFAFVISKRNFNVTRIPISKLTHTIEKYNEAINDKNVTQFKWKSFEIYEAILGPLKKQLTGTKVIIVPDGPLWHLNFDLLLTSNENTSNPKEMPFLLRDYAISYANSATYLFKDIEKSKSESNECLAFSFSDSLNVNVSEGLNLATLRNSKKDLPGSRKEIKEISNLVEGEYFYGSEANEVNFKANAGSYGILHLSLHGEVDQKESENSKLFFTQNKDTLEDNFLYAHEIFAMNIPAELAVLSACSTGSGKITAGEGMMSLGNAFQYAGTKSLLMTHWEVSDEVAPELIRFFYTNLKEGMDKSTALQQAKLKYLQEADVFRSNPYYWGSFYLVGDISPINLHVSHVTLYVILFLAFALLVFVIFWLRKTKANKF